MIPLLVSGLLGLQDDDETFAPPEHHRSCPSECGPCREAMKRAVAYLAQAQREDGTWEVKMIAYQMYGNAGEIPTAATSALCLLAAGSTTSKGEHSAQLRRTRDYILKKMKETDLFKSLPPKGGMMRNWHLAYALILMTELQAREKEEVTAAAIRQLVEMLQKTQEKAGGWKHGQGAVYRDILITTVLALAALESARSLGFQASEGAIEKGRGYIKGCLAKDGRIYYSPDFNSDVRNGDEARAAAVSYLFKRWGLTSEMVYLKAKEFARAHAREIAGHSLHTSAVSNLFGGLDAWAHGAEDWERYWKLLRNDLLEVQRLDGHFRWQRKWDNAYQLDGRIGFAWVTSNYLLFMQIPSANLLLQKGVSTK
jgi:hypothetical protein